MPRRLVASTADEQVEPPLQTSQDGAGRQCPAACGRQLDRERQAVEPSTQLGDRRAVVGVESEVRLDIPSLPHEQRHRRDGLQDVRRQRSAGRRRGQRLERVQAFPAHAQRFAAGGQHGDLRTGIQQSRDGRTCAEHVLAVVEQQQQVALGQIQPQLVVGRAF